jgi:outer membrane receptor for ferrienterochelin and colicin
LALRSEYSFERFKNGPPIGQGGEVNTYRIPLGINFSHPSGFSSSLTATYYNQDGRFMRFTGLLESGQDDFWTVDAAINYRLPKRYGFITVGVANLFDKKFKYYDLDNNNPRIQPARTVLFKVTLALP